MSPSPEPGLSSGRDSPSAPLGAYTRLEDLIRLRFDGRKLRELGSIRPRSDNVGSRTSRQRARGIDFEEVRLYQQGDDVRTIDWRVTARTSTAHTKIFRAERDRPVFIIADQRQSMFFGSRSCCKSVHAAHLSGLLAWSAYHRGDQVGGCVLGSKHINEVRPGRGYRTVLQLLHHINLHNNALGLVRDGAENTRMERVLGDLRKSLRPGTTIFIISDGHDLDTEDRRISAHLHYLTRNCQLRWLHLSDLLERRMPTRGRYLFTDGAERIELHMARSRSSSFSMRFERQLRQISDYLGRFGIPLTRVDTGEAPLEVLNGRINK